MRISTLEYLNQLKNFRGENIFLQAEQKHQEKGMIGIELIEKETGVKLPPVYKCFFKKFYPFAFNIDFSGVPDEVAMPIVCNSEGGNSYFSFDCFFTEKEIIHGWKYLVGDLNEQFKWSLIRVGNFTQGGIYMGFGEENKDKIYWVDPQSLWDDKDYRNPTGWDVYGIRYLAKDIYAFLKTLSLGYDPMDYL